MRIVKTPIVAPAQHLYETLAELKERRDRLRQTAKHCAPQDHAMAASYTQLADDLDKRISEWEALNSAA